MNENSFVGRVIEVFIPTKDKNGKNVDVMDNMEIGFRVLLKTGEVITIVQNQNKENVCILRDNMVMIKRNENGLDIYKLGGE